MILGRFRFDVPNQRLYQGSAETPLTSKAAAILSHLTKRPNELVTHDELLDEIWGGVHVQPEVLKVYIAELRRALRDTASKPRYIETVHGRGYRFIRPPEKASIRTGHAARLVGRDRELACLLKHLRLASRGHRQLVFITGEPGIGKTAFLDSFFRRLGTRFNALAARGQCADINANAEAFSPFLDALSRVFQGNDREKLMPAFLQNAPAWLVQFPDLRGVTGIAQLRDELTDVTRQRMIREFGQAVESFSRDALLVLSLDDIQRADSSTLDLLAYMGTRNGTSRLLIIAAAEEGRDWDRVRALMAPLYARRLCEQIRLDVLSESEVKRFLDIRYPSSNVATVLSAPLHRISNGVPLFLCSAIDHMEARRWILKTGNGWLATIPAVQLEELVPPVLTDLVEAELSSFPPEHQEILEAASIIGLAFTSQLVAYALDVSHQAIEDACNKLILSDSRWLEPAGFAITPDGEMSPQFRFRRKVYKEVLYTRQTPSERVKRHRRVANALEGAMGDRAQESASELAFHFAAGEECSKSIEYLRAAAQNATRCYAGAEAAVLLSEALKLTACESRSSRIRSELEILNDLGAAYLACGDFDSCARAWHQAAVKAMKHGRGDVAVSALSRLAFPVGWDNPRRLRSCADRVIAHIGNVDDPATRAEITIRTLALRDVAGAWSADHAAIAAEALTEVSQIDDPVRVASARITHAWLQLRHAAYGAVIAEVEEALHVVLQHRCVDVIRAEWVLGWALLHAGEWGRMQSVVASAVAHANKNGNSRIEALFTTQLAWLHVECGEYDRARELCRSLLKGSENLKHGVGLAMRHVIAGMAAIGLLDPDAAMAHVAIARRSVPSGECFWRALAEMNALNAHLLRPDISEARRSAGKLLELTSGMPEKTWKAIVLSACAKTAALDKHDASARENLYQAIQIIDSADLPLAAWRVEAAAAEIFSTCGSQQEAARFAGRSRCSRERLFNSLDGKDALAASSSRIMTAAFKTRA